MSSLKNNQVFKNFVEYWHYTKNLSEDHRQIIYKSLPIEERNRITKSFERGKWQDVFSRNAINGILDDVKDKFGYDLLELRSQALRGKSVYIPRIIWDYTLFELKGFDEESTNLVVGGIHGVVCKENEDIVLLLPIGQEE